MLRSQPVEESLRHALECGEVVEWVEVPRAAWINEESRKWRVFGFIWTTSSVCWIVFGAIPGMGIAILHHRFFRIVGTLSMLMGIGLLMWSRYLYRRSLRRVYVITNRRAIIIDGSQTTSYRPESLLNITRTDTEDGGGDVVFEKQITIDLEGIECTRIVGFLGVANPRETERKLRVLVDSTGK